MENSTSQVSIIDLNRSVTSGSVTSGISIYGYGKIVDTLVFEDRIEIVYKCEPSITTYPGNNYPKIYKEIYSRTDGTMQKVDGKYIPPQELEESYDFEN